MNDTCIVYHFAIYTGRSHQRVTSNVFKAPRALDIKFVRLLILRVIWHSILVLLGIERLPAGTIEEYVKPSARTHSSDIDDRIRLSYEV